VLFDYFISQTNEHTLQKLDKGNYKDSELIEISIPLNLPYYTSWNEYERYDGEIELNKVHYNFVKRKVVNDTLYLLCLPNEIKTELYKAKNEFAAKESGNTPSSSKKGYESFGKKNIETENNHQHFQYSLIAISTNTWQHTIFAARLTSCYISSPAKPPEITS
jgi:hypothetical protein